MVKEEITAIVIDDDYDTVELLVECLELNGIRILAKGYDGKDAVTLFEKFRPDVIFLDIMMPKYDGFYAARRIIDINPNSKIIMVTADLTQETAKKLEELKVLWIYKPYELDNLMSLVNKVVTETTT